MTIDERSTAEHGVGPEWSIIDRPRFHSLWDELPALTVLATLPGWGRTEWMRQCRARLVDRSPESSLPWVTHRGDAIESLTTASAGAVVFVDDVVIGRDDPLWSTIAHAVERGARVVVSSIDSPRAEPTAASVRILDERDLRFTPGEITELVDAEGIPVGTDTRDDLDIRLKGAPHLVRRQLERLRARHGERVWAGIALTLERPLLDAIITRSTAHPESTFLGLLRRGGGVPAVLGAAPRRGDGGRESRPCGAVRPPRRRPARVVRRLR